MEDIASLPFQPTNEPFLFPVGLYGSKAESRRSWSNLQRKAETCGTWAVPLTEMEMVCITHDETLFALDIFGFDNCRSIWHMYWIGETLSDRFTFEQRDTYDLLTILGFDYSWFCLGILASGLYCSPNKQRNCDFFREMLRRYIYWIPELSQIQERCVFSMDMDSYTSAPFQWQTELAALAKLAIPDLEERREFRRFAPVFRASITPRLFINRQTESILARPDYEPIDIAELLIRSNVIEMVVDRYRLVDSPE